MGLFIIRDVERGSYELEIYFIPGDCWGGLSVFSWLRSRFYVAASNPYFYSSVVYAFANKYHCSDFYCHCHSSTNIHANSHLVTNPDAHCDNHTSVYRHVAAAN